MKPTSSRGLNSDSYPTQIDYPRLIVRDFGALGFLTQDLDALVTIHRLLYSQQTFDAFKHATLAPLPFQNDIFESSKKLTIGYCYSDEVMKTIPAMKRAIEESKQKLERMGHRLVEWHAPNWREAFLLYLKALTIDGTVNVIRQIKDDVEICNQNKLSIRASIVPHWMKCLAAYFARFYIGDFPADALRSVRKGDHPHDANIEYLGVVNYRKMFAQKFQESKLDALLWPSFACPALPLDAPKDALAALSYTVLFNLLDWPAGVCPVTEVTEEDEKQMINYPEHDIFHRVVKKYSSSETIGLPVGVQIAAPRYQEELILRIMQELD